MKRVVVFGLLFAGERYAWSAGARKAVDVAQRDVQRAHEQALRDVKTS